VSSQGLKALAFADDTTGALETGAGFVQAGVDALVVIQPEPNLTGGGATALVIDTRSRRLTPPQAYERALHLGQAARRLGVKHLFKKTDSTLRGNVGAEFRGLLESWPEAVIFYAPAYPRMGRTVVNGALYVDGSRLEETPFANDPLNPSRQSYIPAVLAEDCGASITVAGGDRIASLLSELPAGSILVCDGASDEDLERAAAAVARAARPLIVAGTGAFSSRWIRSLGIAGVASMQVPSAERCLVVNGSLHPRSREQVRHAQEEAIPVWRLDADRHEDDSVARVLESWLVTHRWCLLAAPETRVGSPDAVSARLAGIVSRVLESGVPDGLVVFGGDTVLNILDASGVADLQPLGELLDGVPVSRFAFRGRPLVLVTKAGGFGPRDVIFKIRTKLGEVE
jgi:uncharacterized protein YgbK (DUF1537 family)